MHNPKRVGLVGVTGYTGMELARILATHPGLELTRATSRSEAGKTLQQLFPGLAKTRLAGLTVTQPDIDDLKASCDVVFLAVPHGTAMDMAGQLIDAGARVVDLSADFRLRDKEVYSAWYKLEHRRPGLLSKAVYGLPEIYRQQIASAQLVANPGCYPTSAILALWPAISKGMVKSNGIVVDSKSGTTGAGRKPSVGTLYCEVADTFRGYNLGGKHRHTPEIEQEVSQVAGAPVVISFNPHLVPMNRGILTTAYAELANGMSASDAHGIYERFYAAEPWVRVLPAGELPQTRWVRGTMFCDIGVVVDERAKRLIVVSAIDNLCRGASGQAVANANLMLGIGADTGLEAAPLAP